MEKNKDKSPLELALAELEKLKKINKALMGRVESSINSQAGAFSLFEGNILLTNKVAERTQQLEVLTERLSQERKKIERVVAAIPGLMLIFDSNEKIVEIYKGTGPSLLEVFETQNLSTMPEEFQKEFQTRKGLVETQPQENQYFRFMLTSNPNRPFKEAQRWFNASLTRYDSNWIAAHLVDCTQQIETENMVKSHEMQMLQSAKFSALGEMAAGIAHEINNPITIIAGMAGRIKRLLETGEMEKANFEPPVEAITKTSHRIAAIVKGLKSFSRSAEGDPKSNFSLKEIITDTLSFCEARFKAHQVEIQLTEVPPVYLNCRPAQICQVLLNLLNNAFDAIEVISTEKKWVRVEFEIIGTQILIKVSDTGTGIDPEVLDKIMHPFFTTKEMGKGTGLGLSVSKGIIEEHSGSLYYDKTSKNTCFIIKLPYFSAPNSSQSKPTN